jgi:hypothetical protein
MTTVGGLDLHRRQITFDYLDTATGELHRGRIAPADREHLRVWLARVAGESGDLAVEGCTVRGRGTGRGRATPASGRAGRDRDRARTQAAGQDRQGRRELAT